MEKEKIIVTKEGFEKLKAELRNLIDVIRPEVIQELKEARAQGDLSENADYDAARARQAEVEARINQLTEQIDNAEIIELHHNQKKDAPSGTAIKTALMMSEAKETFKKGNCAETETIQGSRGGTSYSDIQIHSVRMPGYIASQEVIFGSSGQIFKIRHDSMDRKCYMGGILMAVNHVFEKNDFVYGLENIMK